MDPTEAAYRQMMERFWLMGVQDFLIAATTTPEEFFGFTAMDIECVHRRLAGFGAGTWFRLHDGRVVDWCARPSTTTRAIYDVTIH
jgi:hypothetical protein